MAESSHHTVYRLSKRGSINDLQPHREPVPKIDQHEVLVRIRAVTLNYRDVAIVTGGFYPAPVKDSLVPCSDGAGEVAAVGASVYGFEVGDYVIANFDLSHQYGPQRDMSHGQGGPIDGTLRQYVAYPATSLVKIPKSTGLSFLEMAALVCTGTTAWNALYGLIPIRPGQVVLFQGTGGVSITGLLIAKAAGAVTIVTSSSSAKLEIAKTQYGADHTINYTTSNWSQEAMRLTNGRGVDLIFDNAGGAAIRQSLECIAFGGTVACIGFLDRNLENMPDVGQLALFRGCNVRGILVGGKQLLEELVLFATNKGVKIPVSQAYGFSREQVVMAFEHVKSQQHIGKVGIIVE